MLYIKMNNWIGIAISRAFIWPFTHYKTVNISRSNQFWNYQSQRTDFSWTGIERVNTNTLTLWHRCIFKCYLSTLLGKHCRIWSREEIDLNQDFLERSCLSNGWEICTKIITLTLYTDLKNRLKKFKKYTLTTKNLGK